MAGAISQPRQSCQFLFCLMKNPLLYRSAWPESSREASERFLMETLGRTQSERRLRLALAGGFRLLRSSGIDRLDAPAHAAGRGIIDGGDNLQGTAAVATVFHVDSLRRV